MRISLMAFLLFSTSILMANPGNDSIFSDDSVCNVAQSSLGAFLGKIPIGYESHYGFNNRDEFKMATTGTPLRVYTVYQDSTADTANNASDNPVALNKWRVPVMINGKPRSLLTVTVVDNVLKAVDLGAAELAKEIGQYDERFQGHRRALLRLDPLKCDFLVLDRNNLGFNDGEYYPLQSAVPAFSVKGNPHRSHRELFTEIHHKYRERK